MWATIGSVVLKSVADKLLNNDNEPTNGRYYGQSSRASSSYAAIEYPEDPVAPLHERQMTLRCNNSVCQSATMASQSQTTCHNCNNSVGNGSTTRKQGSVSRKQKDKNKFCMVSMPDSGNFEVVIKKTEAQFGNMNLKASKQRQNFSGSNTVQKKFDKNQRQQNGNHNRPLKNNQNLQNSTTVGNRNERLNFRKNTLGDQSKNINLHPENNIRFPMKASKTNSLQNFQKSALSSCQSTWMYLGRLKIGTTEADIRSYLAEIFPGHKFKIESLPLYRDGKLPCFKVQVENDILDDFQLLDHWPLGVKITKYQNKVFK